MTPRQYARLVKEISPKSPIGKDCLNAFWIGGLICCLGQLIKNGYLALELSEKAASTAMSMTLVALSALLTGLSLYDNLAKHAGAGTIVPITGFANSVVSPALEFKAEGIIMGTGANIFKIAGPVIAYGTFAAVVYGILCYIFQLY